MRFIDADKLENDIVEHITVKAVSRVLAITQGQPTIDAIPVEWIEKWIEIDRNAKRRTPYYYKRLFRSRLKMMLNDWEKENGTDR